IAPLRQRRHRIRGSPLRPQHSPNNPQIVQRLLQRVHILDHRLSSHSRPHLLGRLRTLRILTPVLLITDRLRARLVQLLARTLVPPRRSNRPTRLQLTRHTHQPPSTNDHPSLRCTGQHESKSPHSQHHYGCDAPAPRPAAGRYARPGERTTARSAPHPRDTHRPIAAPNPRARRQRCSRPSRYSPARRRAQSRTRSQPSTGSHPQTTPTAASPARPGPGPPNPAEPSSSSPDAHAPPTAPTAHAHACTQAPQSAAHDTHAAYTHSSRT